MKAFLIDPFKRTVSEVNYSGDFEDIYLAIDCDTFTCVQASERGDTLFVDDEGLINGKEQAFFGWMGYPQPLAGKALLLGTDINGESVATTLTLDEVNESVVWLSLINMNGQNMFVCTNANETEH